MPSINKDIAPLVRDWERGVLRVLNVQLQRRKIGVTGDLKRNLQGKVIERASEVIAEITMPYSGRFVDMGAGRGQTARQARQSRRTARRRKPWYNKNVYGALNSLQGAVGMRVVDEVIDQYQNSIPQKIKI